ncbi:hypothetical protein [Micromonospora parathelypteridis]|uniref:Uncharacterized protein n=1 Tax=Micromonospora parathelypteridis TaxID=1839617 RepID=A0A840VL90_9ACTN|nr:hypothetical protein [Micromonospora parathelypteridis]MBB5476686.1 hypothetical protein [Micromonospora parathelypteridis]GGO16489.1 hypothetical protein GCM10011576_29420 [Micromonospora parathelypteridis]
MSHRELYCDICEGMAPFETPPCVDGHDADCPELICTGCGAAVVIATFAYPVTRLAERRRPQPARRHAA